MKRKMLALLLAGVLVLQSGSAVCAGETVSVETTVSETERETLAAVGEAETITTESETTAAETKTITAESETTAAETKTITTESETTAAETKPSRQSQKQPLRKPRRP